jgi:hypothetical protein
MKKSSRIWIWIILVIVLLICVVFAYDIGGIKTSIENKGNTAQQNKCPNGIIPDNLDFYYGSTNLDNSGWYPFFNIQGSWADGKGIENSNDYNDMPSQFFKNLPIEFILSDCIYGSEEGQNVNYLYCVPKIYTSDKVLDKEGNITKNNIKYKVYLTLEPLAKVDIIKYQESLPAIKSIDVTGDYKWVEEGISRDLIINTKIISAECVKQ